MMHRGKVRIVLLQRFLVGLVKDALEQVFAGLVGERHRVERVQKLGSHAWMVFNWLLSLLERQLARLIQRQ